MTVFRRHHSSSYNNPINMKSVQLALVFFAIVVLALAAPPNRERKPYRPNPRIHRRTDETTTFRTYQPKYNPFKSTVLRTSSSDSRIGTKNSLPMRSEVRFRHTNLQRELSTDPTYISVPVEEPVVISSTDANFVSPTEPELQSLRDLESFSSSPPSETPLTSSAESVSSSPLPPFSQPYVTHRPFIPLPTTPEPYYSTVSSSQLTSNSIPNRPVLLRPLTSKFLKPQLETPKSSSDSTNKPISSVETNSFKTPKSLFSALPRPNTLDPSSRVPKVLAPLSSPNRPPPAAMQTSASLVSQLSPVSPSSRSAKSLNFPPALSPPQGPGVSVFPVLANSEPKPKPPVPSVSSTLFVQSPPRNPKSVSVQVGSNGYTNGVPTSYSFAYKVNDPSKKQDFGHSEKRVGNNTKGRYDVLLPDGRRQVVDYQILDDRGYVADVTYQSS